MEINQQKFDELLKKVETSKKSGGIDLSTEEDLSIAIMNLISLEEHFYFTGVKTNKDEYFDMLQQIRAMRQELLAKMINKTEGEVWCISKHLLGATMRLIEVGTKLNADGKKDDAKKMFEKAHEIYSMFWALRLKLVDLDKAQIKPVNGQPWTLKDIMDKLVDCCDEK